MPLADLAKNASNSKVHLFNLKWLKKGATTLTITTFSLTSISIMTLRIMGLVTTLSTNDIQHRHSA
jgi:hypothetical protein